MVSLRPWLLLLTASYFLNIFQTYSKDDRKTYIIYMGDHPKDMEPTSLPSLHMSMAQKVLGSNFVSDAIIHSYKKSFNGFVMKLTASEAKTMAKMDGVVSVFPNKENMLQTTRSWDFIGFPKQVRKASYESDIIIGVLDSGIWPESDSFSDKEFGPPPAKWKGSCYNFTCNNKLIGAKSFIKGDISPRDTEGHGTHCASTAAGNFAGSASLYGLASGTARGGVPSARIASYKICTKVSCSDANILAGFDEAIADGVDIISLSVGSKVVRHKQYFEDPNAIGAFHSMKKGILTSNSASNKGPKLFTMSTYAPWILSVAATTTDRKFITKVQLGNGKIYEGVSVNTFEPRNKTYPLIYVGHTPNGSVDEKLLNGKIVLLEPGVEIESVYGAAGVLKASSGRRDVAYLYPLPASVISKKQYRLIYSYINSTRNARATIFKSNEFKDLEAPYAYSHSSRGPNPITPDIIKPDIAAPGVDILAAWTLATSITGLDWDKRKAPYRINSGTSMACPHAAGAAAYVKSFHPNWSPAAIKSALMTTATPISSTLNPEAEFAYGAGQINPVKAVNPGLVYDISEKDYIQFLCGQGYDTAKFKRLTNYLIPCTEVVTARDLNLPSFALNTGGSITGVFHRTVTNVGSANSTYKAKVIAPSVLKIEVNPRVLKFTSVGEKKSFTLSIEGSNNVNIVSASLTWDDGSHKVKSPIVVYNESTKKAGTE